jgi:parallel beta-helix repeat protein
MLRTPLVALALLISGPAFATDYYVDGVNGLQSNLGTSAQPFKYFWQATKVVKPGDTVHVLPTMVYPEISVTVSGTSTQPITIVGAGASPNLTQVNGGGINFGFWINASYVTVKNFDVSGPGNWSGIYVTAKQSHVTITGNVVHDSGVDGIATYADDYMTISHNTVYANSQYTAGGIFGSGISMLGNLDIDSNTGVKMRIDSNVVYANTNVPTCPLTGCTAANQDSDGSGIIIDDSRRTYWDNIAYHGRTLISNNIVFGNGGRGVHVYLSDHVTIADNTAYFNNQDPYEGNYQPGEIEANGSGDVSAYNNILYSDGLTGINNGQNTGHHFGIAFQYGNGGGQLIAKYNLVFNPANNSALLYSTQKNTLPVTVSQNSWGDPGMNNPSLDTAIADFHPSAASIALGTGNAANSIGADIMQVSRVVAPSIGAYQKSGS